LLCLDMSQESVKEVINENSEDTSGTSLVELKSISTLEILYREDSVDETSKDYTEEEEELDNRSLFSSRPFTSEVPIAFSRYSTPRLNEKQTSLTMPDIEGLQNRIGGTFSICKVFSGIVLVVLVGIFSIILSSIHRIEEGNVGVYYKYGAIMNTVTHPGIHYMTPFVVDVFEIQIRPQTDTLNPMRSVTKDGIQNTFKDVQVITRIRVDKLVYMIKNYGREFKQALVFDRIKEELRIFCANSTIDEVYNTKFLAIVAQVRQNVIDSITRLGDGGLEVLNLVVPKPEIPDDIAHNYKQVKVQWTQQLVATQQQKTESIKKETEKIRAIADAERNKAVLEIKIQEKIIEKEGDMNISAISNNILKAKEENIANIEKYKIEKEAEANKALYTSEYVQLNMAKAMSNNTKYYFSGQESALGGLMTKIFGN